MTSSEGYIILAVVAVLALVALISLLSPTSQSSVNPLLYLIGVNHALQFDPVPRPARRHVLRLRERFGRALLFYRHLRLRNEQYVS